MYIRDNFRFIYSVMYINFERKYFIIKVMDRIIGNKFFIYYVIVYFILLVYYGLEEFYIFN